MGVMWVLHDYRVGGGVYLINILAASLVAWWFVQFERLMLWLSIIGTFQTALGLLEFMGMNFWHYEVAWAQFKPTAFMGEEATLGAFLVACLPAALFSGRWWAAVPIAACILATHSSMALAGLCVVTVMFLWSHSARLAAALCAAGACLVPIAPGWLLDPNGRLIFWRYAWQNYVVKRPIFGFGPGFWWDEAPLVFSGKLSEPLRLTHIHNEFIEGQVELGALGMAIVAAGILAFAWKIRPTWHHATVAALLVVACGHFIAHIAPIGVIFLTAWLLCIQRERSVLFLKRHGGRH